MRIGFAAFTLALTFATSGEAAQIVKDGVYGIICIHPETGDVDGFQFRFTTNRAGGRVEMVGCEGGCGPTTILKAPTRSVGDNLQFDLTEVDHDQAGRQFPLTSAFTARMIGGRLVIKAHGTLYSGSTFRLKPLAQSRCDRGWGRARQLLDDRPAR